MPEGYDKPTSLSSTPEPIWEAVQKRYGNAEGGYEKAVQFVLALADALQIVDETRYQRMLDAIRRARYEDALHEALGA